MEAVRAGNDILLMPADVGKAIAAIKKAENNNDLILRLFEPTGRARTTNLSLPALGKKLKVSLGRFEIKTLRVNLKTKKIREVNLLER